MIENRILSALAEGKSYILFPDRPRVVQRWSTIGLAFVPEVGNPDTLNVFRMFVSGDSADDVYQYLLYHQGKAPDGVQLSVQHLDALPDGYQKPQVSPPKIEDLIKQFNNSQDDPDFLFQEGDVNFGIQRLYVGTLPPYKVMYSIDPVIPQNRVNQGQARNTAQFSADIASVSCHADAGHVDVDLQEFAYWGQWVSRATLSNVGVAPQNIPTTPNSFTGQWQVQITGRNALNVYTLAYSIINV